MGTKEVKYSLKRRLYSILVIAICLFIGCKAGKTPKKFKNNTTVFSAVYNSHKHHIEDSIYSFIKKGIKPYYPLENDSSTKIFVDTILYSPLRDRVAFFIISENSNDKLIGAGEIGKYHFNANCFIAYCGKADKIYNIEWLSAYNLSRYPSYREASKDIRIIYLNNFKGKGSSKLKYNLDDVRFWGDVNIWKTTKNEIME
jgi:hypothetical protein